MNIGYARVSATDQDLDAQIAALEAVGCDPIRVEKRSIDTSTSVGEAFLAMFEKVAAFDSNGRRERQLDGNAAAKAGGVYKRGRKRSIDYEAVAKLKAKGLGATEIAKQLGIARASVYRKY
jgi:DNA invertase Pin-like site-specific DNA recombinase